MNDIEIILGVQGLPKYQADMGKAAQATSNATNSITNGLKNAASAFGLLTGAAAAAGLVKSAVSSAIAYETLNIQFEVFLGSAEKATKVLGDLNKFSIETPFTPDQVNAAGRSLLAFGITAEKLIPTMKMVGDVSAAVGKDFNELATIYGKARTAGTLFAEDINQLTEAGVPIIEELARVMGVGADQVKKLGSEGKIHFSTLEKAFANMTSEGGRFAGMMDKMSQSTEGLLSSIEGQLQDALREIGKTLLVGVKALIDFYNNNQVLIASFVKATAIVGGAVLAWKAYSIVAAALPGILATVQAAYIAFTSATNLATGAVHALKVAMAASPWGVALLAVGALTGAIFALNSIFGRAVDSGKRLSDLSKELGDRVGKETGQVNRLFAALKNETTSKDDKSKIVQVLLNQYGSYLGNLNSEKALLGDIEGAQKRVNEAIEAKVIAQLKAEKQDDLFRQRTEARLAAFGEAARRAQEDGVGTIPKGVVENFVTQRAEFIQSLAKQGGDSRKALAEFDAEMRGLLRQIQAETGNIGAQDIGFEIVKASEKVAELDKRILEIDKDFAALGGKTIPLITGGVAGMGDAFKFAAGSIGHYEELLKVLQERHKAATTDFSRNKINTQIDAINLQLERLRGNLDLIKTISFLPVEKSALEKETEAWKEYWGTVTNTEGMGQRGADFLGQQPDFVTQIEEQVGRLQLLGATLKETFKDVAMSIKQSMVSIAADFAFAFGEAIASGGKIGDVFKTAIRDLLVEIPKLAGMALLNAAIFPGNAAIALPLAALGLGLLGLSGLISGIFKGKEGKSNSIASDIPAPAVQRTQNNSLAAFGASVNNSIGQQVADALDGRRMQLVLSDGKQLDAYVKDANKRNNEREGK